MVRERKNNMKLILNAFRGFCMALADSVPGVSGGTIAFLMGFYDKFIGSINDIIKGPNDKRKTGLVWLINLGVGWVIGMGIAVVILKKVFELHIYAVSSLFLGFIILAIPVMISEEKDSLNCKNTSAVLSSIFFTILGAAIVVVVAYLGTSGTIKMDTANMGVGLAVYTVIAGMLAISAMVLPGISGSTILLTFGIYVPVITGLSELMHFNFTSLGLIISLAVGVIAGAFVTLPLIKKGLEKHRRQMMYLVIGMMVGSLYAIVMGPKTLKEPKPSMTVSTFSIVFFIIGAAIVFGMQMAKKFASDKTEKTENLEEVE